MRVYVAQGKFCDVGFWKYSRHPNYAGEIFMWWGIWISALPVIMVKNSANGWGTIASPLFTMILLLFGSGMPTAEGSALSRYYR